MSFVFLFTIYVSKDGSEMFRAVSAGNFQKLILKWAEKSRKANNTVIHEVTRLENKGATGGGISFYEKVCNNG